MTAGAGLSAADDPLRILIIDHHDSYTLNLLISIAEATTCSPSVVVLAHDHALLATVDRFKQHLLPHFDAIILGPGPGHPANEEDFGPARRILAAVLEQEIRIPILGVCLGHQGIALACGGRVVQADSLRHGLSSAVSLAHLDRKDLAFPDLFEGINRGLPDCDLQVIRYNSLTVDEGSLPTGLVVTAWSNDASCQCLPPVRNDYSPPQGNVAGPSTPSPQRVVMGLQHRSLPLYGVQFHPESISSQGGAAIMRQFLHICRQSWVESMSTRANSQACDRSHTRQQSHSLPDWVQKLGSSLVASSVPNLISAMRKTKRLKVVTKAIDCSITYESACIVYERLFKAEKAAGTSIWLDSARQGDPQSRFSYMAKPSWHLSYKREERRAELHGSDKAENASIASLDVDRPLAGSDTEVIHGLVTPRASRPNSPNSDATHHQNGFWTWLSTVQRELEESVEINGDGGCPFKTGFVGYFDYEMKEESLKRGSGGRKRTRMSSDTASTLPAVWFGFCDRLLAYDHVENRWLCVALVRLDDERLEGHSIGPLQEALRHDGQRIGLSPTDAETWMSEVGSTLKEMSSETIKRSTARRPVLPPLSPSDTSSVYKKKVEAARAYIAQGESYEICLTNQFEGRSIEGEDDYGFRLYESLRMKNPAPYSAFLDLGFGRSILSTSPERFMNIDQDGSVEMRPIKGTLARAGYRAAEEQYRQGRGNGDRDAVLWCEEEDNRRRRALECDPKERAENLMIVDLIRADLLSFCSPESVKVPRLMKVESYESVHQLITTIVGQKDPSVGPVEALQRCFPPGSMTGAPKVRSVEILEQLEGRPRGVYSGILGWIGLDGAASTSVVIRTVVVNGRKVSIGAGGAITYLSDAEKEWQEVLDKFSSIATLAK